MIVFPCTVCKGFETIFSEPCLTTSISSVAEILPLLFKRSNKYQTEPRPRPVLQLIDHPQRPEIREILSQRAASAREEASIRGRRSQVFPSFTLTQRRNPQAGESPPAVPEVPRPLIQGLNKSLDLRRHQPIEKSDGCLHFYECHPESNGI